MSETKHTPGPWEVRQPQRSHGLFVEAPTRDICQMVGRVDDERKANAEFIVRACNAHDELVDVCKCLLEDLLAQDKDAPKFASVIRARAALAKATVQP